MKIERINDKTVKCYISNEELEGYNIDYKDFLTRSEKAKEMLHEIVLQAEAEVGFVPPQFAFDLQIMVVPEQGLVLTLSESELLEKPKNWTPTPEEITQLAAKMAQAAKQIQQRGALAGISPRAEDASENRQKVEAEDKQQEKPQYSLFRFPSLHQIGEFAAALPERLRVISRVYKLQGDYYLYLERGSASYPKYSKACVQALEFAELYSAEKQNVQFLEEQGECIIPEKAILRLGKIYRS